jgi:K+-transporting ATPase KdpF subunit
MTDLALVVASIAFFWITAGYVRGCVRLQEATMTLETWVGLIASLLLLAYLVYALLKPEKF